MNSLSKTKLVLSNEGNNGNNENLTTNKIKSDENLINFLYKNNLINQKD